MITIKVECQDPGSLTALIAKACFHSGFYVQSFSLGNVGYIKFDKKFIISKQEEFPDFLVLPDASTLDTSIRYAKEKSVVIIKSAEKPKSAVAKKRKIRIYNVNSESAAPALLMNALMLGALSKVCIHITSKAAKAVISADRDSHAFFEEGFRNVK